MISLGRALAPATLAVTVLLTAPPAFADRSHIAINEGTGWSHDATAPLFDFSRIAPGWSATKTVDVRNDLPAAATLHLTAANIADNENGCDHSERYVDTSCAGPRAGELGHELVFAIHRVADNGSVDPSTLWSGTVYDLEHGVVLDDSLPSRASQSYELAAELPTTSGNETQTDTVGFDLTLTLEDGGTASSTSVEGAKFTRPSSGSSLPLIAALPFTGSPASRMIASAAWLLIAGALMIVLARLRRRPGA
jgi:hypothetical protein